MSIIKLILEASLNYLYFPQKLLDERNVFKNDTTRALIGIFKS